MYHSWTRTTALWLSIAGLASVSVAQLHPVGYRDQLLANSTAQGSPRIAVRFYYPATTSGQSTKRRVSPAQGFPVLVWLGGFAHLGSDYPSFCNYIAGSGYVVVALNSTANDLQLQRDDGRALFSALKRETQDPGAAFYKALDIGRIAIAGHSMGGGNVVRILAQNPGYRLGIGYSAWQGPVINGRSFPHQYAKAVKVPMLLLHGEGDNVIPWRESSKLYQDRLVNTAEFSVFHRMSRSCDHANLVSLLPTHLPSMQVFFESMHVTLSALELELGRVKSSLDGVVGEAARGHVQFVDQDVRLDRTAVWADRTPRIGKKIAIKALAGAGDLLLFAGIRGQLNTPWGTLGLAPTSLVVLGHLRVQRLGDTLSHVFIVPPVRSLIGKTVSFQALSLTAGSSDRLDLTIEEAR